MVRYATEQDHVCGKLVGPSCEQKANGHWYCATHDRHLVNGFEKDTHIATGGEHVLAWACNDHGFEVP